MVNLTPYLKSDYYHKGPEGFQDQVSAYGLEIKSLVFDKIERVRDSHKKGANSNGWYILHEESGIYYGAFGSWSRGESVKYCSVSDRELTIEQRMNIKARQKKAEAEAERLRQNAAERAENAIDSSPPASADHPYLVSKHIKAHGIFQKGPDLLIPVYNAQGDLRTYQTISPSGKKLFLKDGEVQGNFYRIGQPSSKRVYVAEGFATAASIHEHTGACVFVAFNCGNILPVCRSVRQLLPDSQIVVAADNDQWNYKADGSQDNPGIEAARSAASSIKNCSFVFPSFKNVSTKPKDFNDLFQLEGKESLLVQLGERGDRIKASPFGDINPTLLPKREFLYGNHLIRKYCSATISPGGVGKTQLVMTDAIALASGIMLLHDRPEERVNVWHYNLEDPLDELQRRALAICQFHKINPSEIQNTLFLDSGRDQPLIVMEKTKQGEYARPDAEALYKTIKENNISVLSIDPFVKVHYGDENSNKDIDEVLKVFSQIANDTNCAIDLVHHTKKSGKGESHAGNMDAARGASALAGAVRSARTLTGMTEEEALAFQIVNKSWFVRVDNAKANMAAPMDHTHWLERHSIELPNGDKVGTLGIWKPPSIYDRINQTMIDNLIEMINDGSYRKDVRSKDWVGHLVMDQLNMNEQEAKRLIHKWVKEGSFIFDIETNPANRNRVWYVKINPEKHPKI